MGGVEERADMIAGNCAAVRFGQGGELESQKEGGRFVQRVSFFVLQFPEEYAMIPSRRGCSSSVERQLPKLHRGVRLPSAAPKKQLALQAVFCF